jgi:hypothetical protein
MTLKRARELGVEVSNAGLDFEFVETWEKDGTRIVIRNVKNSEPLSAKVEHYIAKENIQNGEIIWVSQPYHDRNGARVAAAAEFESRLPDRNEIPVDSE